MINFIGNRKMFYIVSFSFILVGLVMFIVRGGLNLDIDFSGGTSMRVEIGQEFVNGDIEAIVKEYNGGASVIVQKSNETEALIRTTDMESVAREGVFGALQEKYGLPDTALIETSNVGASTSTRLIYEAGQAILYAMLFMLIYISFRFELKSGLAAVFALFVNVLVMLSVYAIFGLPVNSTFIAAILTIVGYSINDTIVVFDKIRENMKTARREPFAETANRSVNQTLTRTINTSVTTLITIGTLYILGVPAIREFAFPIVVGIIVGTFSSICIAAPTWVVARGFSGFKASKKKAKKA